MKKILENELRRRIDHERDGPVVDQFDLHVRGEAAGRDRHAERLERDDELLVERFRDRRRRSVR